MKTEPGTEALLRQTSDLAAAYLAGLPDRHVGGTATRTGLLDAFGGPLPDGPADPSEVVRMLALRFAAALSERDGFEVLNDVVLNQVLIRVGDDDAKTRATASAVQREGSAWLDGTTWHGVGALRISVAAAEQ